MSPDDGAAEILVVEDDESVREMLVAVLSDEGHRVEVHPNGEAAIVDPTAIGTDLLILDVGLPGVNGLDVCHHVRRRGRAGPILVLTARGEVGDRVDGLDAGADDYLVKPFALDELLARVRALLRRGAFERAPAASTVVEIDDLVIDPSTREAHRGGALLDLTRLEFDLLHLLVREAPAVVTREAIHLEVWGHEQDHMSNSLEVFVSQLRRKTEVGGRRRLLHTVRGVGYAARVVDDR